MGKTCCFFGHRDAPDSVKPMLRASVCSLLAENPEIEFLVGNQGRFDALTLSVLKELEGEGMVVNYSVVLAYLPEDKSKLPAAPEHTLYPEGIESVPKRFAISWRNKWMIRESDVVICYISHWFGRAATFVERATKQGKKIINLAELTSVIGTSIDRYE